MFRYIFLIVFLTVLLSACVTKPNLTNHAINERYQNVLMLGKQLELADTLELELLSPSYFNEAQKAYDRAYRLGLKGNASADNAAKKGLQSLEKARVSADVSRELLADVLVARQKAKTAGSSAQVSKRFDEANQKLKQLAKMVEKNEVDKVNMQRLKLANEFSSIELSALKRNTVDLARSAISNAEKKDIGKNAPKSLGKAKAEMRLAVDILEMDRVDYEKAEQHAKTALLWVQRATALSDTINNYRHANYTEEDVLLWYQDQLANAFQPLNADLPFNKSNRYLIESIKNEISAVLDANSALATENFHLKTDNQQLAMSSLKSQAAFESKITKTKEEATQDDRKFAFVQALFDEKEAQVYRQKNEVLIRALGFKFDTGKTEIDSTNFPLMEKLITTIKEYPNAKIVVSGHTDATGSESLNQQLSEQRAEKVAKFLIDVGKLKADRVQSKGYGESRPLASNSTTEGRIANRRIEISLLN